MDQVNIDTNNDKLKGLLKRCDTRLGKIEGNLAGLLTNCDEEIEQVERGLITLLENCDKEIEGVQEDHEQIRESLQNLRKKKKGKTLESLLIKPQYIKVFTTNITELLDTVRGHRQVFKELIDLAKKAGDPCQPDLSDYINAEFVCLTCERVTTNVIARLDGLCNYAYSLIPPQQIVTLPDAKQVCTLLGDTRRTLLPPKILGSAKELPESVARIHYQRPDGNYEGFKLHVWGDTTHEVTWPDGLALEDEDDYGAYWDVYLKENAAKVGFIVYKGDEKEPEIILDLGQHNREIWIQAGDDKIYKMPTPTTETSATRKIKEDSNYDL